MVYGLVRLRSFGLIRFTLLSRGRLKVFVVDGEGILNLVSKLVVFINPIDSQYAPLRR